jgi:peptidoglycan/LPS O-acetylase OafA/YrhL
MESDQMSGIPLTAQSRSNNFGALRLLFAALVVVGHSSDLVGAPPLTEPLRSVFGTLSFGEVAVDGFFIISGYLITKSFLSPAPLSRFLLSRVLRIYPGYIVAFLISFYLVGWLGDGDISKGLFAQLRTMLLLKAPDVHGVFPGLAQPETNGPMWSLAEEFRCYCMVVLLGLTTLLRRRSVFLTLVVIGLCLLTFRSFGIVRMASIFLCGMSFYLFRDRIRYNWGIAIVASIGWCATMRYRSLCEPGTAIFGGYLIFWFAFNIRSQALNKIGRTTDISYGLYLYGWPIAELIVFYHRAVPAWQLTAMTLPLAAGAGFLSWILIEGPALRLKENTFLLAALERMTTAMQRGVITALARAVGSGPTTRHIAEDKPTSSGTVSSMLSAAAAEYSAGSGKP